MKPALYSSQDVDRQSAQKKQKINRMKQSRFMHNQTFIQVRRQFCMSSDAKIFEDLLCYFHEAAFVCFSMKMFWRNRTKMFSDTTNTNEKHDGNFRGF